MADIIGIKAFRYNKEIVKDLSKVVAPPYDVISKEKQEELYRGHDNNIIRLELGKKLATDTDQENVYTRAAQTYAQWKKEGILKQDTKPSLYFYQQEFNVNGEKKIRSGFLCGLKAEGYASGNVKPHEETLPKHKADRLQLMHHTMANFSPIFGLYSQPEQTAFHLLKEAATKKEPDIAITDGEVKHRLWVIDEADTVQKVCASLKELPIYIADGHHRYETASTFAEQMRAQGIKNCDYIMIALVNLYDEGLVVLPTHRLMKNIKDFNTQTLLQNLKNDFIITQVSGQGKEGLQKLLLEMAQKGAQIPTFGIYTGENHFYVAQLKDKEMTKHYAPEHCQAWRDLDVSVLHSLVLEKQLGVGPKELAAEGYVTYTRNDWEAIQAVDDGDCQISFLLNSTLVQQVLDVAGAGDKMPQKSTFFYPKVISGLIINPLGE